MKKRLLVLALIAFMLGACRGNNTSDGGRNGEQQTIKYTVHFANTSMEDVQIEAGKTLSKPADPSKANSLFVGWYFDATFNQEVSFPLTINAETTIYAQFYSYQEAFQKARNNTIGDDVPGYEYDYTLQITAGYMGLGLTGNTTGNSKYSSISTDVSFYDSHVNSGALFYDGTKYSIKKGRELHEVSLDENDVVKNYKITEVGDDYKYDSSSFAKAVFEYDDTKLKEIKPTSTANEYELKTGFNASAAIALVGNYINHPMIEKIIGELPETSVDTGMYVTFSGDKLNSYRYTMAIDVSDVQFNLTYNLTFKNVGVAPTITPKAFNNTYVSNSDVANAKNEINGYLNAYKTLEHSSYDFKAKTAVDYAKKNAINATIDGWTKRKVSGNNVYYLNDYEVDTDHKNADLYKATGLGDCHGGRVKLSTGEVHDLKKKVLGGYSDVATVSNPGNVDDYYLLDILGMISNVSFIQKITDTSKNTITYAVGAETSGAVSVLKIFNDALRLNPLGESTADVKAFGSFSDSSVTVKNFEFRIIIANGTLSEIKLEMNGKLSASFPGSRDFTQVQDAGYKLEYELKVTDNGSDYEPAATVDKVK
ncbi:MAG: InlB B-repeat-containing protein [Candidatus Onthovivens sp.]